MGAKARPMPSDFVEVAKVLGVNALQAHYKAGQNAVDRWIKKAAINVSRRRAMPDDFIEQAKTLCRLDLAKHYKTGDTQVNRWLAEAGITPVRSANTGGKRGDPPPAELAELAPTMTKSSLARHYSRHFRVIERWLSELGIEALEYVFVPKEKPPRQKRASLHTWVRPGDYQIARTRVSTIYDDAAFVLRGYAATYRCDERGRFDERGKFWRMGNSLMTPDELLERAARYREKVA